MVSMALSVAVTRSEVLRLETDVVTDGSAASIMSPASRATEMRVSWMATRSSWELRYSTRALSTQERLVEDSSLAELRGEEGAELKMDTEADVEVEWDMIEVVDVLPVAGYSEGEQIDR